MLDIGHATQDLVRLFEPANRWLFVKIVVLAFAVTAVARLWPKRPRRTTKRTKRGVVTLRVFASVLAVATVAACVVFAIRSDRYVSAYNKQLIAFEHRPAHASLTAGVGSYLGIYEPGVPRTFGPIEQFAKATNSHPRVALYYSGWNMAFQSKFAEIAYSHGSITMVQMMPYTVGVQTIADGRYDGYLRSYAISVRQFRHAVIIGFAPEMNGNWYKWGYLNADPQAWVAAWRHIVTVFRANGADNVSWLWTVNMVYNGSGPLTDYWPGSNYVTWVGIDAYFVPQKHAFNAVVAPTLALVRRITSDPVLLSETGIAPAAGKAATLHQIFAGLRADKLLGFVYFDGNQPQGANYHYAWRLEDSPAAMTAYSHLAQANLELATSGSVGSAATTGGY